MEPSEDHKLIATIAAYEFRWKKMRERITELEAERDALKMGAADNQAWADQAISDMEEAEAKFDSLMAGKCHCWQERGATEKSHGDHCPEQAAKLMAGYCARIRELNARVDELECEALGNTYTGRMVFDAEAKAERFGKELCAEQKRHGVARAKYDHAQEEGSRLIGRVDKLMARVAWLEKSLDDIQCYTMDKNTVEMVAKALAPEPCSVCHGGRGVSPVCPECGNDSTIADGRGTTPKSWNFEDCQKCGYVAKRIGEPCEGCKRPSLGAPLEKT